MGVLDPGRPVRTWLSGPAALYGWAARLRWRAYRQGWLVSSHVPCRVVSVGNITIGGTGKTPLVILFAEWLQQAGYRVAVLSRGYKRTSRDRQLLVSDGRRVCATVAEAGDEPYLIARRCPAAIVAVGSDRAGLARWILKQFPVDCFLLDDGFQHLSLQRDADVVLLDATDAAGLDAMFPAGRLREPLAGLARASAVVITRAESKDDVQAIRRRLASVPGPSSAPAEVLFQPESLVAVSGETSMTIDECRGQNAWLVSGIGNSESFRRSVEAAGIRMAGETRFQDHHGYSAYDVKAAEAQAHAAGAEWLLTTEKDAGKLAPLVPSSRRWWALRIRAEVVTGEDALRRVVCGGGPTAREAHA